MGEAGVTLVHTLKNIRNILEYMVKKYLANVKYYFTLMLVH